MMSPTRLRVEFGPELVTQKMREEGLAKSWFEPLATTTTIGELIDQLSEHFHLEPRKLAQLQLSSGGFTLPHSSGMSLLRDGDVVVVNCSSSTNAVASGTVSLTDHSEAVTHREAIEDKRASAGDVDAPPVWLGTSTAPLQHTGFDCSQQSFSLFITQPWQQQIPVSQRMSVGHQQLQQQHSTSSLGLSVPSQHQPLPGPALSTEGFPSSRRGRSPEAGTDGPNKRQAIPKAPPQAGACKPRPSYAEADKPCLVCRSKFGHETLVPLSKMREHVGSHILWGDISSSACGFCGLEDSNCSSCLKTVNRILRPTSTCPYYCKFSHKALHRAERRTVRCTNAPLLCTACPPEECNFVWKYNMQAHWTAQHPEKMDAGAAQFPGEYLVMADEVYEVKKRIRRSADGFTDGGVPAPLLISKAREAGGAASGCTKDGRKLQAWDYGGFDAVGHDGGSSNVTRAMGGSDAGDQSWGQASDSGLQGGSTSEGHFRGAVPISGQHMPQALEGQSRMLDKVSDLSRLDPELRHCLLAVASPPSRLASRTEQRPAREIIGVGKASSGPFAPFSGILPSWYTPSVHETRGPAGNIPEQQGGGGHYGHGQVPGSGPQGQQAQLGHRWPPQQHQEQLLPSTHSFSCAGQTPWEQQKAQPQVPLQYWQPAHVSHQGADVQGFSSSQEPQPLPQQLWHQQQDNPQQQQQEQPQHLCDSQQQREQEQQGGEHFDAVITLQPSLGLSSIGLSCFDADFYSPSSVRGYNLEFARSAFAPPPASSDVYDQHGSFVAKSYDWTEADQLALQGVLGAMSPPYAADILRLPGSGVADGHFGVRRGGGDSSGGGGEVELSRCCVGPLSNTSGCYTRLSSPASPTLRHLAAPIAVMSPAQVLSPDMFLSPSQHFSSNVPSPPFSVARSIAGRD